MSSPLPLVSILLPVHNEERQIAETLRVIAGVLASCGVSWEFVVVDDGSTDGTWAELNRLQAAIPVLRAFRLSRNFGKEGALCAGLDAVRGQACIVMDADLQHPPDVLPEMIRLWRDEGFPLVEGVKRTRGREGLGHRLGAGCFYGVLRRLSGLDLRQASDFKLLDARIVAVWKLLHERETFFRGLTAWLGFRRAKVYFDVAPRARGASKWSRLRLVRYAISAMLSFSALPMQIVTTLGFVFLAVAIPLGLQTLYNKFSGHASDGFTTVITLQLVIGSVLMISLGIIGSYIARIFEEVKRRPRYLISEQTTREGGGKEATGS